MRSKVLRCILFAVPFLFCGATWADTPGTAPHSLSQIVSWQNAIQKLDAVIQSGSLSGGKLAEAYFQRGAIKVAVHDTKGAIADFSSALEIDKSMLFYLARATAYGLESQTDKETDDVNAAEKLAPSSPAPHFVLAEMYKKQNNEEAYNKEFDVAAELSPNPAWIYLDRAENRFVKGEFEKAIADYNTSLVHKPNQPDVISDRADSELALGDYAHALSDYDSALKLDSSKTSYAARNRIQALYALGRYAEAAEYAASQADAMPAEAYVLLWLRYARARLGKFDDQDFAKRAAALDEAKWPWPIVAFDMGKISEQKVHEAAEVGSSNDVQGQRCEAAFHLGEYRIERGDAVAAIDFFRTARQICPPGFTEFAASRMELSRLRGD